MIDFHNHLMPGVDDGASNDEEALTGLDAMWAQGVRTIVATPHIDASLTVRAGELEQRLAALDDGWQRLQSVALKRHPAMTVKRGAEVMLDLPQPNLDDARLRLAGGRFVLVEYPYMMIPPQSGNVLHSIAAAGYVPIIAHPERYVGMTQDSPLPLEWRERGALLQINAGSLTGRYGPAARTNVMALLQRGLADFLCSDFHARGRPATVTARNALLELDAADQAELLMIVNPQRMLNDEPPIPVPPVTHRPTMIERVRGWFS